MRIEEKNGVFSISMAQDKEVNIQRRGNNVSIFAKELGGHQETNIEKKRREAMEKAVKVISNQFADDKKIDDGMAERRQKIESAQSNAKEANDQINALREERVKLKEEYGIKDDSQEEKDLEIIRKAAKDGVYSLTEEENARLANMGELTDYQHRALALYATEDLFRDQIEENLQTVSEEGAAITSTKQSLLARNWQVTMIGAGKRGEELMDAASKEIMGMAMAEAKDYLDEKMAELVEAAKKRAEEEKEQQEKLDEMRKKKDEMEQRVEELQQENKITAETVKPVETEPELEEIQAANTDSQTDLQRTLRKIAQESELLDEDLKGLVVNRQF